MEVLKYFEFPNGYVKVPLHVKTLFTSMPIELICDTIHNIWPKITLDTELITVEITNLMGWNL